MNTTSKDEGQLAKAAAAFERELERYEKLSLELSRTPVRSEKSLSRARKLLADTNESEAELGRLLEGLSAAMRVARETQQTCMQRIQDATEAAQRRAEEFAKLIERVAMLNFPYLEYVKDWPTWTRTCRAWSATPRRCSPPPKTATGPR